MSNLIVSLWRAQTFAYLAYHLSWFLFGFYPCENLELVFISIPSSSSSKTDFLCISCYVFDIGGFTGLSFLERSNSLFVVSSSHDGLNNLKVIQNRVLMNIVLRFVCWRIYRLFLLERFTFLHLVSSSIIGL